MKQILQHLKTGRIEVAEVPCPSVSRGQILIRTSRSLISAGTERMLIEFGKGNLIQKARSQPDKVKQVLDKIRSDGLAPTLEAVFRKLDEPLPLGYCNAGVVLEIGPDIAGIRPGDRVISNGSHAEFVRAPRNLTAIIPDNVGDETAAFTVLGAVALQGIRLAKPELGERFVVFGMGILGLLTVQLLLANGCEVLAVDLNAKRLAVAESFGAKIVDLSSGEDPVAAAMAWTGGSGVDGVLVTASAKTDDIMHQAAEACRKRGRIVLVGMVGLNLRRDDFYKKELTFQVSCSYGPGRYDETYEREGRDYPLPYVRWTEQRNFEAVLGAMASGALNVEPLITHRFALSDAVTAYDTIRQDPDAIGVLLEYSESADLSNSVAVTASPERVSKGQVRSGADSGHEVTVGVIGAGNFSKAILLPALAKTKARIAYVADLNPHAAHDAAQKNRAVEATTDYRRILDNPHVKAVFVLLRHHLHAQFVCEALEAGKHVFVEKPLAIDELQLDLVEEAAKNHSDLAVMVGFNRRFSPHAVKLKEWLAGRSEPLTMNMTVNAGAIPADHWTQNPEIGGGRIVGECCHFIDLFSYLAGSHVTRVSAMTVGEGPEVREDKVSILLNFSDGSLGALNYFANGSKSYPKETLEVFSDGRTFRMENFRRTKAWGMPGSRTFKTFRQDKGHLAEVAAFIEAIGSGAGSAGSPIPFDEIFNTSRAAFAAVRSVREGIVVPVC